MQFMCPLAAGLDLAGVPQGRMRLLVRVQDDREIVEVVLVAVERERVRREHRPQHLERLVEVLLHPVRLEPPQLVFGKADAAAHAHVETALEQMIEGADLFGQADGVVERQQVHQRREPDAGGVLRSSGKEQAHLRDGIQPDHVVLGLVEPFEARLLGGAHDGEAVAIQLVQRLLAHLDLVEHAVSHRPTPPHPARPVPSRPARRRYFSSRPPE